MIRSRYDYDYDRRLKTRKVFDGERFPFEKELTVDERPMINSQRIPSVDERLVIVSDDDVKPFLSIFKTFKKFPMCNPEISAGEIDLCYKRDKSLNNVGVNCEFQDKNCRFKLACTRHNRKLICKKGEHVYTDVICCDFKCK